MHQYRWPTRGGGNVARVTARCSLGLVFAAVAQAGSLPRYSVDIIQQQCAWPYPPAVTFATGLNNHGQVCGRFWHCVTLDDIGFVWTRETGIVVIPPPQGVVKMQPEDINDNEQIAGSVWLASGHQRGFLLSDGQWTFIEPLCPSEHNYGRALNANGAFTGGRWTALSCIPPLCSFVYEAGMITDIKPAKGTGSVDARDLNIHNEVVGGLLSASTMQAFLWRSGRFVELPGPPGTTFNIAWSINDCSIAVGWAESPPRAGALSTALQWQQAIPLQLPILPGYNESSASGVSERLGIIVGGCSSPGLPGRAVMWRGDEVIDLNTLIDDPGWFYLGGASSINDSGQILCGAGSIPSGEIFAVLLTPLTSVVGDLDGDGEVGVLDVTALLAAWGGCPDPCNCSSDLDGNQIVNGFDLAILLANWS